MFTRAIRPTEAVAPRVMTLAVFGLWVALQSTVAQHAPALALVPGPDRPSSVGPQDSPTCEYKGVLRQPERSGEIQIAVGKPVRNVQHHSVVDCDRLMFLSAWVSRTGLSQQLAKSPPCRIVRYPLLVGGADGDPSRA